MSVLFPEYYYKDTAIGGANKRGRIMRTQDIGKAVQASARQECYTTWARFPQAFADYVVEHGSVRGWKGSHYADFLWLDVDSKDEQGKPDPARAGVLALNLAIALIRQFQVDPKDLRFYFSGAKGFHIGVPSETFGVEPHENLSRAFKILAKRIAEQAGVTIDGAVYDTTRLWRLPNTINGKTGLYKIPITPQELGRLGLDAILEMATAPRDKFDGEGERPNSANELLASFYQQALQRVEEGGTSKSRIDLPVIQSDAPAEWPKRDKMCIARMMQGVTTDRNSVAYRIGVHLRQKGMSLDVAEAAMQAWNRKNNPPMDDVEVSEVTRKAFEYGHDHGCNDLILDAYCHQSCFIWPQKNKESNSLQKLEIDILTPAEAMARYMAYIQDRDLANVSWGLPWLDNVTRCVRPGQVGMVLARAGVGKTAFINHVIRANSAKAIPSLFCSLEQLAEDIFERMAQSVTELTGKVIEDKFYDQDEQFIAGVGAAVCAGFSHAYICDKDALTIDQLKGYVTAAETKAGTKIRLLCVDYLGRMRGTGKDQYERISEIAKGLKNVAKECGLAVIVVVQLNRTAGKGTVEVEMDMARDSGQIEEAADYAVGMWRASGDEKTRGAPVSITTAEGTYLVQETESVYPVMLKVLKNRKGAKGDHVRLPLIFRADVMRFEDIHWTPDRPVPPCDPDTGEILEEAGPW